MRACSEVDILIHAASISQPDTAEYNPEECVKTNVIGAQNVIDVALICNIKILFHYHQIRHVHQLIYMEHPSYYPINFLLQPII